jgi:uncharacterized protein YigA (DUF484 family)
MVDIQEQLRIAQSRVKTLASKRDQIIRDAGIEEQKLQQIHDNLRQLGVGSPETLSSEELQALAEETNAKLKETLQSLMESLSKGEALLMEYDKLQQG